MQPETACCEQVLCCLQVHVLGDRKGRLTSWCRDNAAAASRSAGNTAAVMNAEACDSETARFLNTPVTCTSIKTNMPGVTTNCLMKPGH